MKYIIQFFENHAVRKNSDSYCMFQVIFSAKSKEEAKKKSIIALNKWKKEHQDETYWDGITYTQQTMPLSEFIKIKEKQYKAVFE